MNTWREGEERGEGKSPRGQERKKQEGSKRTGERGGGKQPLLYWARPIWLLPGNCGSGVQTEYQHCYPHQKKKRKKLQIHCLAPKKYQQGEFLFFFKTQALFYIAVVR